MDDSYSDSYSDSDSDSEIDDGRFMFLYSPPKLELISTRVIARHLVFDELNHDAENISDPSKSFKLRNWINDRVDKMLSNLPSIAAIRSAMTDQIKFVGTEISRWVMVNEGSALDVFLWICDVNERRFVTSDFLAEFVWNFDGEIDYVKTAEKLIRGTNLTEKEKFKMACEYCMEDEIDDMYDTYDWLDVDDCTELEEFSKNNYILYWDSAREGLDVEMPEDDDQSFELYLLETAPCNVTALRYFFSQLEDEEREDFANGRMLTLPMRTVKHIIPLYTELEQKDLFVKNVVEMMENITCDMPVEQCLQFWNFVKPMLRGKQYIQMLLAIFECPEHVGHKSSSWMAEYTMEIWNTSPSHLKQFVFREQNNNFVLKWNKWYSNVQDDNYRLRNDAMLLQILSDGGVEYRTRFWLKEWNNLIIEVRPPALRTLLEICLPDTRAREEFKKRIIESNLMKACLDKLLDIGLIIEINQFLDILLPEPSQRTDYKKKMIPDFVRLPEQFINGWETPSDEQIDAFGKFIDEIKHRDDNDDNDDDEDDEGENTPEECKVRAISAAFVPFIDERFIERRIFNNILHVAKRLCDEQKVKLDVKIMFRMFYIFAHSDEDKEEYMKTMVNVNTNRAWRRIMLWVLGSREKMEKFFDEFEVLQDPKYDTGFDECYVSGDEEDGENE
ncbi:uncharacterized protein LOC135844912 isoform X1 [Planococcus citri]|uniref:uncharacterized protein LOC135844912 isoform X1 n=1 Tax=Planococcus citri TaxID=170843 RepID=UPI0031F897F8